MIHVCLFPVIFVIVLVTLLRAHAKVDKVVRRGANVIANMAAASRDCAEVLVAQGVGAVLEAIAADTDRSATAQSAVREALASLNCTVATSSATIEIES